MDADIDSLRIKIEATSSDAAEKINQLATALSNLKVAAKGGAGLTTTTKQLKALSDAAKLINGTNLDSAKLQKFAQAMNSLSAIQKASGLNSTINALRKLPEISNAIGKMDLDTFAAQMRRVADAMRPLADQMQRVSNGFSAFPARIQALIRSNSGLTQSNNTLTRSFGGLSLRFGAYALIFRQIASVMSDWVKESNDYVENLNLFTVAMGEYAESAQAYAEQVQEIMGIDSSEWMRNQGVFMQMASGFGVATDAAALMSKNLTQLGYDISSFYNISIEDAMQKLQSGFAGEIEPLRRLGYAIDIASLEQVALNHGITESVNAMSQAEKSQLRYVAIMEQSTNAMGDMARTIQTPANAMRILNQQITQLSRALGNMLIPILQQIIPWVQAFVEVLTEAAQAIANFLGFTLPTIDYSSLDGVSVGASNAEDAMNGAAAAAKDMKRQLLGIDELNIIESPASSGGGGAGAGASGGDLGLDLPEYDFLQGLESQIDEHKKKLESILKVVLAIGAAFAAWKIATGIANGIVGIKTGLDVIKAAIGLVAGSGAWAAIQSVLNWIAGAIAAIVIQFNAAGGGAAGLLSVIKLIAGALATPATVIAIIAAQLVNLWTNSEKFRKGIERIGEVIQGVFTVVSDILSGIITVLGDVAQGFIDLLPDPVKDLIVSAISTIKDWLGQLDIGFGDLGVTIAGIVFLFVPGGQVLGVILLAFEAITVGIRALGGVADETWENIKTSAGNAWNGIKEGAGQMWEGIKQAFSDFGGWIAQGWTNFKESFSAGWNQFWQKDLPNGLAAGINTAISGVESGLNWIISKLNSFSFTTPSWLPLGLGGKTFGLNIPKITLGRVSFFESGGFPDYGEMFIARESGPELVGRIGNRTAVANNDQIVDGIASANEGVINAIYAMAQQVISAIENNGGDVYMDGDKVGQKVTQYQNRQNRMYGKTLQRI